MVDYIRAHFINKDEIEAKFREKIGLKGVYDFNYEQIEYPLKTKLDNMGVKFTEHSGLVENSIHKKFNIMTKKENQNYDDFDYCSLCSVLKSLEQELDTKLSLTHLTQFEFGFNIKIGFSPSVILRNNILMYKYKAPCVDPKNLSNKKIKKFVFRNYEIKVYDKSLHFGLKKESDFDILRIEVKYKSKKEFNKLGVFGLEDLLDKEVLKNIFDDFIKKIDCLLIVDSYDGSSSMNRKEKEFFTNCTHPCYWNKLADNYHRNTISNKKVKFQKLIKKFQLDEWKTEIDSLLIEKFKQLIKNDYYESNIKKCA